MSNSTKMRAPWNVLEWRRKGKFSYRRESFGIKLKKKREREKEREPEKERENGAPGMFWRRKKRKIKEGGSDSGGHVCGGEKQEKKKEKWMKRMAESEMKKGKII